MPRDSERIAEVRAWLNKACRDLTACSTLLEGAQPVTDAAVFHAQQAAEKAIKGFLTWHDVQFGKTHNLVEIGRQATAIDPSLEPLLRRAARLTGYAWRFRYPGEPDEPSHEEARAARDLAGEVFAALSALLPEEARSDR